MTQEEAIIREALTICKGRKVRAAEYLGVHVETLNSHLARLGIGWREFRGPMCTCQNKPPKCEVCRTNNRERMRRVHGSVPRVPKPKPEPKIAYPKHYSPAIYKPMGREAKVLAAAERLDGIRRKA